MEGRLRSRIYRRALSTAEIRQGMDTDKLALPAYRKGHPIAFSLCDKDENYVLYIGDDPRDHHYLNLELSNTSALKMLCQTREKIVPETGVWDLFSPGEDSQSGTVSVNKNMRASCEWGLDARSPRRSSRSPWGLTMLIRSRW
jgi:hypothetical protein